MKAVAATIRHARSGVEAEYERQRELLQNLVDRPAQDGPRHTWSPGWSPVGGRTDDAASHPRGLGPGGLPHRRVRPALAHTRLCSPRPPGEQAHGPGRR